MGTDESAQGNDTNGQQPANTNNQTVQPPHMDGMGGPGGKSKKMWLFIGLIVIVAVAALLTGLMLHKSTPKAATTATREIKVGVLVPLTGDDASYGEVLQHGLEMAQSDFSDPNLSFQLLVRDTQCDPGLAASATTELVKAGVTAIIGDTCSGSTAAAVPIAAAHHVVLISPSASSPLLTGISPYFLRDYPTDSHQGVFVSKLIHDAGIKRVAIMHSSEAYGTGLDSVAVANLKQLGVTVVADDTFQTTDVNFQTQLQAIKAANPDALYVITNGEAAGAAIVVEAKQLGLNVPIYGSDALKDSSFLSDVGSAGEGMKVVGVSTGNVKFLNEYKATYGAEPVAATGDQAYDAFMALAQVIKNGATTGDQIRTALHNIDFQGVSGEVKFDKNGDLAGGAYNVFTIKNGQFVQTN